MNTKNKYDLLDILAIFQTGLSVINYQENLKQSTNDDVIRELHNQNKNYLVKIIEQNEKIIELLEKGDKKCIKQLLNK